MSTYKIMCPECGSNEVYCQLLGYTGRDENRATCAKCGAHGMKADWELFAEIAHVLRKLPKNFRKIVLDKR